MRVELDIKDNAFREIRTLMKECNFKTEKEFFDGAITLMRWAVTQARNGNLVAAVDKHDSNFVELQMDFLEHANPRQRRQQS